MKHAEPSNTLEQPSTRNDLNWSDTRTFYLPPEKWNEPYTLEGAEAQHLTRVLRIKVGQDIRLLDGEGREGAFKVLAHHKQHSELECLDIWQHPKPAHQLILATGWTKAARRGWIFEKAVELGAAGVWMWQAQRSQFPVPPTPPSTWQAQLVAGAKQCRNPWLPSLKTFPNGLTSLLTACQELAPVERHLLVESDHPSSHYLDPERLAVPGVTVCVIGPEGGLSKSEVVAFMEADFLPITLGKRVLRWETAALFCLNLHWWQACRTLP